MGTDLPSEHKVSTRAFQELLVTKVGAEGGAAGYLVTTTWKVQLGKKIRPIPTATIDPLTPLNPSLSNPLRFDPLHNRLRNR